MSQVRPQKPSQTDITVDVHRVDGTSVSWHLAEEVPVALVYNATNYAVMLATPADLEDFAVGFSISERVVDRVDAIKAVEIRSRPQGIDLMIRIDERSFERLSLREGRRNLAGRSGCGICGIDNAEGFFEPLARVAESLAKIDPQAARRAVDEFPARQPLNLQTRSVHGAAWVDWTGEIAAVREDIGRHNALDKLLGAQARAGTNMKSGFVLVSSRCSYELVEKAARFGVTALMSLSAPTAFALRKAREANLALYTWSAEGLISVS